MDVKMIVMLGLACVFIPILVVGLSTLDAQWSTVATYITYPILIVFFIGVIVSIMRNR